MVVELGWLIPDGIGYASYLPSLILDGDLHFSNQYSITGMIRQGATHGSRVTSNGYVSNPWGIGSSVLWLPFWLLGHLLTYASALWGQKWAPYGFSVYYNMGIRFGTALYAVGCILLICRSLKNLVQVRTAILTGILITLGTPFYWYTFLHADLAHIPAAFAIALFFLLWYSDKLGSDPKNGFLLGILGGLIAAIKPNDVLIFLFPLVSQLKNFSFQKSIAILSGALIAGGLQVCVWQILYGHPLGPVHDPSLHYAFFVGHFRLIDVLFSSYHGLFFFSPVLILSLVGLFLLARRDALTGMVCLVVIVLQIALMASERYFWEGAAFGLRRLVDWTPLLAIGLGCFLEKLKKPGLIAATIATLWTILLAITYSGYPAAVLYDFQPAHVILKWVQTSITSFPSRFLQMIQPALPMTILIPGILVFSIPGYFILKSFIKLRESSEKQKLFLIPVGILLVPLLASYLLVGRAAVNADAARKRYAADVSKLLLNQNREIALLEVESLLKEGMYIGVTRNWELAKESFREALKVTPDHNSTMQRIREVLNAHLQPDEVEPYVKSLVPEDRSAFTPPPLLFDTQAFLHHFR